MGTSTLVLRHYGNAKEALGLLEFQPQGAEMRDPRESRMVRSASLYQRVDFRDLASLNEVEKMQSEDSQHWPRLIHTDINICTPYMHIERDKERRKLGLDRKAATEVGFQITKYQFFGQMANRKKWPATSHFYLMEWRNEHLGPVTNLIETWHW